jgi:UDP-N-acetylbacillosamine N-acetyltransferase
LADNDAHYLSIVRKQAISHDLAWKVTVTCACNSLDVFSSAQQHMPNVRKNIVIWGAGGHALVVADVIRAGDRYAVAGFFVDPKCSGATRATLAGRVLGGREEMAAVLASGIDLAVVAVGHCERRLELATLLERHGFSLVAVIHPRAIVAPGVDIGPGTVIAAGAVVNPGVTIEENVIINTGATIDHESRICAGAHVSPGAHLAGNVVVGRATWIGIGATIIDGVTIGANTLIGAGAVVLSDIPDGVVAFGAPAKIVGSNGGRTGNQ